MTHNLLVWGFPFYLILVEALFRAGTGTDTKSFIGSAIAAAGLSFLLPLTKPKDVAASVEPEIAAKIKAAGGTIFSHRDQQLIPLVWIFILAGFLVWFAAAREAQVRPSKNFIDWPLVVPTHFAIGFFNYLIAAILTGVKSKV